MPNTEGEGETTLRDRKKKRLLGCVNEERGEEGGREGRRERWGVRTNRSFIQEFH